MDTIEEKSAISIMLTKKSFINATTNSIVCLKDIHLDNVRIFEQGVQKFVQLNLYTAL